MMLQKHKPKAGISSRCFRGLFVFNIFATQSNAPMKTRLVAQKSVNCNNTRFGAETRQTRLAGMNSGVDRRQAKIVVRIEFAWKLASKLRNPRGYAALWRCRLAERKLTSNVRRDTTNSVRPEPFDCAQDRHRRNSSRSRRVSSPPDPSTAALGLRSA